MRWEENNVKSGSKVIHPEETRKGGKKGGREGGREGRRAYHNHLVLAVEAGKGEVHVMGMGLEPWEGGKMIFTPEEGMDGGREGGWGGRAGCIT